MRYIENKYKKIYLMLKVFKKTTLGFDAYTKLLFITYNKYVLGT